MSARRRWAWPLVPLYAAGLAVKHGLRAARVLKVRALAWPVVSVGSLSAGGAGKTPVVIALAKLLKVHGWNVNVLSRGYGRAGVGVERVAVGDGKQVLRSAQDDNIFPDHSHQTFPVRHVQVFPQPHDQISPQPQDDASLHSYENSSRRGPNVFPQICEAASYFGDEPVLIARSTGVPVWVGRERFFAGQAAERFAMKPDLGIDEESLSPGTGPLDPPLTQRSTDRGIFLLDDGFQHQQLGRKLDIVLMTFEDLNDVLLPAGNLREPLSALRRADVIVIRQEERLSMMPRLRELVRAGTPVWSLQRRLRFPAPLGVLSAGLRPMAFCAIARPEGFAEMLQDAGCGIVETVAYADHHAYTTADIEHIIRVANSVKASGFVTTEKDEVKLSAEMQTRLQSVGTLVVVPLEAEFVNPAEVWSDLEERLL